MKYDIVEIQKALDHTSTIIRTDFSKYIQALNDNTIVMDDLEECLEDVGKIVRVSVEFNQLRLITEPCEDPIVTDYIISVINTTIESMQAAIKRLREQFLSEILSDTSVADGVAIEIISTSISHAMSIIEDIMRILKKTNNILL